MLSTTALTSAPGATSTVAPSYAIKSNYSYAPAVDSVTIKAAPLSDTAAELEARKLWIAMAEKDPNGPLRTTLSAEEIARRRAAVLDLSIPFAKTLVSFAPRQELAELPRVSEPGAAERELAAEPAATRIERKVAFAHMDRSPFFMRQRWAVAGDKFVRQATRDATLLEGLSFADIDTSRPMSFFRKLAKSAGTPQLDLNATGKVQIFEVPPVPGVPPLQLQTVLPRPFVEGRPTVIYLTEATSSPFDPTGKPIGTIGEFLGEDMNGLGDVNVVLIRSPYQAEFPNGPRFTAGYDNVKASLAFTTQYMDHVVRHVRSSGSGPVIMGGYSLGGAHVNQYRGWFDNGKSGADHYIPMAAPAGGYGGLFDPATAGGKPTWWSASQLAPAAYKQQKRVARELSPTADELARSAHKVFALVPAWDEAIQGIDSSYGENMKTIPGGHISGAVEAFVDLPVQVLGKNLTLKNWPALGTVTKTHSSFREAVESFVAKAV